MNQYAEAYNVNRCTVLKWIDHGKILTTFRIGRIIRIKHQPPSS